MRGFTTSVHTTGDWFVYLELLNQAEVIRSVDYLMIVFISFSSQVGGISIYFFIFEGTFYKVNVISFTNPYYRSFATKGPIRLDSSADSMRPSIRSHQIR